jgi:protein-S-isoprenylcysteine O-methyltransferase Ste14
MTQAAAGQADKSLLVRAGDWFFKYRNFAFTGVALLMLAGFRPVPLLGDPLADRWLDALGIAIALAGSGFRAWVIGLAYIKRGGLDKKVHADTLVVEGMFSVCRNPLYVGNAMVLLGLFTVHNSPWVWLFGGAFFIFAYVAIIAAEEHFLRNKFGAEYEAYCASVPRMIPNFANYREATKDMAFNWRRPVIKDYSSIYAWVATVLVLMAYEKVAWGLGDFSLPSMAPTLWALGIATFLLALVKVLKKSRLLTDGS